MSNETGDEFENLGDGHYKLSDGRVMTEAELDQALENYFETEQLKDAEGWARRNQFELDMLYNAVARASRSGALLRDLATQKEAMAAIDHQHGEVMGETFSGAVADVEHLSAVTLAAMMREIDAIESSYMEAARQGLSAPQALVRSQTLASPSFIESASPRNFVQAMIVASIVKWIPLRGYHDGKRFFVTPASKDWDILRRLENTPEGQDWIDMAYARSEQDAEDVLPD